MSAVGQLGESAELALHHAINAALQAYSIEYQSAYIKEALQLAIEKTLTGESQGFIVHVNRLSQDQERLFLDTLVDIHSLRTYFFDGPTILVFNQDGNGAGTPSANQTNTQHLEMDERNSNGAAGTVLVVSVTKPLDEPVSLAHAVVGVLTQECAATVSRRPSAISDPTVSSVRAFSAENAAQTERLRESAESSSSGVVGRLEEVDEGAALTRLETWTAHLEESMIEAERTLKVSDATLPSEDYVLVHKAAFSVRALLSWRASLAVPTPVSTWTGVTLSALTRWEALGRSLARLAAETEERLLCLSALHPEVLALEREPLPSAAGVPAQALRAVVLAALASPSLRAELVSGSLLGRLADVVALRMGLHLLGWNAALGDAQAFSRSSILRCQTQLTSPVALASASALGRGWLQGCLEAREEAKELDAPAWTASDEPRGADLPATCAFLESAAHAMRAHDHLLGRLHAAGRCLPEQGALLNEHRAQLERARLDIAGHLRRLALALVRPMVREGFVAELCAGDEHGVSDPSSESPAAWRAALSSHAALVKKTQHEVNVALDQAFAGLQHPTAGLQLLLQLHRPDASSRPAPAALSSAHARSAQAQLWRCAADVADAIARAATASRRALQSRRRALAPGFVGQAGAAAEAAAARSLLRDPARLLGLLQAWELGGGAQGARERAASCLAALAREVLDHERGVVGRWADRQCARGSGVLECDGGLDVEGGGDGEATDVKTGEDLRLLADSGNLNADLLHKSTSWSSPHSFARWVLKTAAETRACLRLGISLPLHLHGLSLVAGSLAERAQRAAALRTRQTRLLSDFSRAEQTVLQDAIWSRSTAHQKPFNCGQDTNKSLDRQGRVASSHAKSESSGSKPDFRASTVAQRDSLWSLPAIAPKPSIADLRQSMLTRGQALPVSASSGQTALASSSSREHGPDSGPTAPGRTPQLPAALSWASFSVDSVLSRSEQQLAVAASRAAAARRCLRPARRALRALKRLSLLPWRAERGAHGAASCEVPELPEMLARVVRRVAWVDGCVVRAQASLSRALLSLESILCGTETGCAPILADLYSLWEWRLLFALVGLVQRSYDDFARQLEVKPATDESPRALIARVLVSRPSPPTPGPTLQPAPASVRALLLEAAAEMLKLGTSVLRWVPGTCRLPGTPPESQERSEAHIEKPPTIPEDAPRSSREVEKPQATGTAPAPSPALAPPSPAALSAGARTRALGMMRAAALASKPTSPSQRQVGKSRNPSSSSGAKVGSLAAFAPAAPRLASITGTRSSSRLAVGSNAQPRASQRRLLSSLSQPRSSAAPGRNALNLGKKGRPGGASDVPSSQASLATLGGELAFAPAIVALAEALAEGAGAAAEDAAKWAGAWPIIPEMLLLAGDEVGASVQAGQGSMTRASSLAASLQCVFADVRRAVRAVVAAPCTHVIRGLCMDFTPLVQDMVAGCLRTADSLVQALAANANTMLQNLQAQLSLTDQGVPLDIAQSIIVSARNQACELRWACRAWLELCVERSSLGDGTNNKCQGPVSSTVSNGGVSSDGAGETLTANSNDSLPKNPPVQEGEKPISLQQVPTPPELEELATRRGISYFEHLDECLERLAATSIGKLKEIEEAKEARAQRADLALKAASEGGPTTTKSAAKSHGGSGEGGRRRQKDTKGVGRRS